MKATSVEVRGATPSQLNIDKKSLRAQKCENVAISSSTCWWKAATQLLENELDAWECTSKNSGKCNQISLHD